MLSLNCVMGLYYWPATATGRPGPQPVMTSYSQTVTGRPGPQLVMTSYSQPATGRPGPQIQPNHEAAVAQYIYV